MSLVTVKLSRGDSSNSWGFRLQGGKDFGSPLAVQRVNPSSLASQGGLQQEDVILSINGQNAEVLRHKEAQETIIRAGNNLEIAVQRGGMSIWKPQVVPINKPQYNQQLSNQPTLVTKTSLAHKQPETKGIGSGHNTAARPFGGAGGEGGGNLPAVVNKQYNTPVNLYSMENIAEALSAQTEVLATGAVGINFMREEKPVNTNSEVYRLIHQDESAPSPQASQGGQPHPLGLSGMNHVSPGAKEPLTPTPASLGLRHVEAPVTNPKPQPQDENPSAKNPSLCAECGRLIVGVFVRVKDRSLHAECFRCATCGTTLKNVGYYNVNDKLYCDIHAKQAANMIGTNPSLEPITVAPGGILPLDTPIVSIGSNPPLGSPRTGAPLLGSPRGQPSLASPRGQPSLASPRGQPSLASPRAQPPQASPRSPGIPGFSNVSPVPFHPGKSPIGPVAAPTFAPAPAPIYAPAPAPIYAPAPAPIQAPSLGSHIYSHPQTAPPADTHRPNQGGSKFIWPPPKGSSPQIQSQVGPTSELNSNATQGIPTYRPPPGTQHVNFSTPLSSPSAPVSPRMGPAVAPKPRLPQPSLSPGGGLGQAVVQPPWKAPAPPTPLLIPAPPLSSLGSSTPGALNSTGLSGLQSQQGQKPAPRRGRGQLKQAGGPGTRIPVCSVCGTPIRGPFIVALGKTWCPDHFLCKNGQCRRPLADVGFVEEQGQLYCECCWESYLAPVCCKCQHRIKGDCLNALDKQWHPECFVCSFCHKPFGNSSFYLEDGQPYCEKDWNELFTTKCVGCGFPIEAGDRWVEALNNNYHSQCFKCTICQKNLEGQSFYAKGGRPFCKAHAR